MTIDTKRYRERIAHQDTYLDEEGRVAARAARIFGISVAIGDLEKLLDVYEAAHEVAEALDAWDLKDSGALRSDVERLTRELKYARDAYRMMSTAYDGKVQGAMMLRALLKEACGIGRRWVGNDGPTERGPWKDDEARLAAIRREGGVE